MVVDTEVDDADINDARIDDAELLYALCYSALSVHEKGC